MKDKIKFEEFVEIEKKLEIMAGRILSSERVPKSKKLLNLQVQFGDEDKDIRTVITSLGETHEPEYFVGVTTLFITNLEPSKMMGIMSEAMILPGTRIPGDLEFDLYSPGTKFFK